MFNRLGLAVLLAVGACSQQTADEAQIARAEEVMSNTTRDPAATQFRSMYICPKDKTLTDGEFNAKNQFGGYAGFEAFIYGPDGTLVTSGDGDFLAALDRCYGSHAERDDAPYLNPPVASSTPEMEATDQAGE